MFLITSSNGIPTSRSYKSEMVSFIFLQIYHNTPPMESLQLTTASLSTVVPGLDIYMTNLSRENVTVKI